MWACIAARVLRGAFPGPGTELGVGILKANIWISASNPFSVFQLLAPNNYKREIQTLS